MPAKPPGCLRDPGEIPYPFTPELTDGSASFEKLGQFPNAWWTEGSSGSGGVSTYTYSVSGGDQNYVRWNFAVPSDGFYDAYAYIPTIASGSLMAEGVKYRILVGNTDAGLGPLIDQSTYANCWVRVLGDLGLHQGVASSIQLGDATSGPINRKVMFDNVGLKRTRDLPGVVTWALGPIGLTLPAGTVGGTTSSATYTLTDTGNAKGTANLSATNGFALSQAAAAPELGQPFSMTISAPACSSVGTQTSTITASGSGNTTTLAVQRVCSAALRPIWTATPQAISVPVGMVGGATSSRAFTLQNTGNGTGTFSVSASSGWSVDVPSGELKPTDPALPITVTAAPCSTAGIVRGTLTISGGGATDATVSLTRTCQAPPPSSAPNPLTITMSSNGRLFVSWPEINDAQVYQFAGTFNGAPLTFSGTINARSGGGPSGAVLVWDTNPSDPAKQGKPLCLQILARNSGGDSPPSMQVCATYRYYAMTGLSARSGGDLPTITISQP